MTEDMSILCLIIIIMMRVITAGYYAMIPRAHLPAQVPGVAMMRAQLTDWIQKVFNTESLMEDTSILCLITMARVIPAIYWYMIPRAHLTVQIPGLVLMLAQLTG